MRITRASSAGIPSICSHAPHHVRRRFSRLLSGASGDFIIITVCDQTAPTQSEDSNRFNHHSDVSVQMVAWMITAFGWRIVLLSWVQLGFIHNNDSNIRLMGKLKMNSTTFGSSSSLHLHLNSQELGSPQSCDTWVDHESYYRNELWCRSCTLKAQIPHDVLRVMFYYFLS